LIVAIIMRRRAIAGQGGNVCNLGRLARSRSCLRSIGCHFRVFAEPKINVIARMAPMTGI
jgi:hypothetical protein